MLNSCVLTGNLGADPEVFYSSEGEPDESAGGENGRSNGHGKSGMHPLRSLCRRLQAGHNNL